MPVVPSSQDAFSYAVISIRTRLGPRRTPERGNAWSGTRGQGVGVSAGLGFGVLNRVMGCVRWGSGVRGLCGLVTSPGKSKRSIFRREFQCAPSGRHYLFKAGWRTDACDWGGSITVSGLGFGASPVGSMFVGGVRGLEVGVSRKLMLRMVLLHCFQRDFRQGEQMAGRGGWRGRGGMRWGGGVGWGTYGPAKCEP